MQPKELRAVNSIIHDRFFDLETLRYDAERRLVTVPFETEDDLRLRVAWKFIFVGGLRIPIVKAVLSIANVVDCHINDTEEVGRYDFNELSFDASLGLLSVRTNIPLTIEIAVSALDVSVELTDELVRYWRGLVWGRASSQRKPDLRRT
jgi:hypothetical protein